jgi:hypothetical protein
MAAGDTTQGHRAPDGEIPTELGGYSKHAADRADDGGPAWWVHPPAVGIGVGILTKHRVVEHDDGSISVPECTSFASSSNSIRIARVHGSSWHGYIDHGVWREV